MALQDVDQLKEILKSPKKTGQISKAVKHEQRLRFHTESYLDPSRISRPTTDFLEWVKGLLPKDKYAIFMHLFRFPTPMVNLTTKIYYELEKVFDGRDSAVIFQFKDSELNQDWDVYRKQVLNDPRVWREDGWETLKTAVNSLVVVDLPTEQTTEKPSPYFYFLGIEKVIDYKLKKDGSFEWVAFCVDENLVAFYDDEQYRVVRLNKKGEIGEVVTDNKHDLGYCPVDWFWHNQIAYKEPDLKRNPITPHLSNYDWALFFGISKRHLDTYAPYPIYSAFEEDCDFLNNKTQEYCEGGFLRDSNDQYMFLTDGSLQKCPACSEKRIMGAGSFIEVPIPKDGEPSLKDPISITTIDKDSLMYNVEEVKRINSQIFESVVGSGGEVQQKEAINETQVKANYEDRTAVLNNLKVNFEKVRMFVYDTCCKLRYGDNYIGSSVNMGSEFYVYSVNDLYQQYNQAKTNGSTESQLNAITEQIIQTENRNNPIQMQRMMLLKEIEPYKNYTREELMAMSGKGLLDEELLRIKINFNSFVERFERENINVLEFGSLLSKDKKIEIITSKLKEYVKEGKDNYRSPNGGQKRTDPTGGSEED